MNYEGFHASLMGRNELQKREGGHVLDNSIFAA